MLAAGFGLLALVHKDLPEFADHLIHRIHLNPEGHLSHLFMRLADRGSDGKLWAMAGGAFAYSVVRFVEATACGTPGSPAEWSLTPSSPDACICRGRSTRFSRTGTGSGC